MESGLCSGREKAGRLVLEWNLDLNCLQWYLGRGWIQCEEIPRMKVLPWYQRTQAGLKGSVWRF